MTVKFINLTPHTLNVHISPTEIMNIEPSGSVARMYNEMVETGKIGHVPIWKNRYGKVEDLPDAQEGFAYIVSGMVEAASPRSDVFAPGNLVRNEAGQPIGCLGLKQS